MADEEATASTSQTVIIDMGTGVTKAGLATESLPAMVFPTLVGAPVKKRGLLKRRDENEDAAGTSEHLVGDEALRNLGRCTLSWPMENGIVKVWSMAEHILNHCFTDLGVDKDNAKVILTEPPYNPTDCKERLAQTLFESFNVAEVAFVPQGICSLYASGRTSGIVLESGQGVTHVTPVFDSFIITKAMNRINFGGHDVTEHLKRIMFERGYNFTNIQDEVSLRKIKEEYCYVAEDYEKVLEEPEGELQAFTLPDGQEIEAGKERFRAPEVVFDPLIIQSELPSVQDLLVGAVKGCGIDLRKELLANVVLSGGNTMFKGYASRLHEEVVKRFPGLFASVNIIDAPDRQFSVWAGASVLASLPSFEQSFIPRDAYLEEGVSIVHNYQGKPTEEEDE